MERVRSSCTSTTKKKQKKKRFLYLRVLRLDGFGALELGPTRCLDGVEFHVSPFLAVIVLLCRAPSNEKKKPSASVHSFPA